MPKNGAPADGTFPPQLAMASASFVLCYIGPGGMLSAIGSFVALLGAVVFAAIGFVWYPLKRLLRRMRRPPQDKPSSGQPGGSEARSVEP